MKKKIIFGAIAIVFVLLSSSSAVAADPTESWGEGVETDAVFKWKITELDANDSTSWVWAFAENTTLEKGDVITYTLGTVSAGIVDPGSSNVVNYNVTIKIGDTELADDPASALYWLILPVFADDPLGEIDSGFIATERFFFNSFFGGQYDWNFDADGVSCDFSKVGVYAKSSDIAKCWITAQDPLWEATEMYMFDIEYNARTGVAKTVTYPSAVPQTALTTATDFWPVGTMVPFHGNSTNNGITEGLDKLVITFQPASAPGFEGPIVISGLFAIAVLVVIRRRK